MNPMIKLSRVDFFITAINESLNADLVITCNDVKVALTSLFSAYEKKILPTKHDFHHHFYTFYFN